MVTLFSTSSSRWSITADLSDRTADLERMYNFSACINMLVEKQWYHVEDNTSSPVENQVPKICRLTSRYSLGFFASRLSTSLSACLKLFASRAFQMGTSRRSRGPRSAISVVVHYELWHDKQQEIVDNNLRIHYKCHARSKASVLLACRVVWYDQSHRNFYGANWRICGTPKREGSAKDLCLHSNKNRNLMQWKAIQGCRTSEAREWGCRPQIYTVLQEVCVSTNTIREIIAF